MGEKSEKDRRRKVLERIAEIREKIVGLNYVCSGTLLQRTKVCGKPTCRCASDPKARHGPYYEWNRMEESRLIHSVVSPEQAKILRRAISNRRKILQLLRKWEIETARIVLGKRGKRR